MPEAPTDRELLARYASAGSPEAFAQIVDRYAGLVYSAARRILGDPRAAEDAAHAVFLMLASRARDLGPGTALGGWLHRAAAEACREIARRPASPSAGAPGPAPSKSARPVSAAVAAAVLVLALGLGAIFLAAFSAV